MACDVASVYVFCMFSEGNSDQFSVRFRDKILHLSDLNKQHAVTQCPVIFCGCCFGSWNTFADLWQLSALIKIVWEILSMPLICSPGDTRRLLSSLHILYQHLIFSHQKRFSQYIYIYQKQNTANAAFWLEDLSWLVLQVTVLTIALSAQL